MRVYLLSPLSVPMNPCLFPTFRKYWEEDGCVFVDRINESQVVFFDLHSRLADYDQRDIDWIESHKTPCVIFDEWDRGLMSNDIYPLPLTEQQRKIFKLIDNDEIKNVHFCRLMDKTQTYSYKIYPYEKSISYEESLLTEDELFNREFDVMFIANTSPSREAITMKFMGHEKMKFRAYIGAKKMSFDEFLNYHKRAKLFISSGAGGFTDERKQCLFSVAGLIQERTNQVVLAPHTHFHNCLMISNPPTEQEIETIYQVVNNKQKLYDLYFNNFKFMKEFYSEKYIAQDILNKIKKHL